MKHQIVLHEWRCELVQMLSVVLLALPFVFAKPSALNLLIVVVAGYGIFIVLSIVYSSISGEKEVIMIYDDYIVLKSSSRFSEKESYTVSYTDLILKFKYIPFFEHLTSKHNKQINIMKCSLEKASYDYLVKQLRKYGVNTSFADSYRKKDLAFIIIFLVVFYISAIVGIDGW